MNDWNWNEKTKNIGVLTLDTPVEIVAHLLTKLERYEYEDYDTFMIEDSNYSKLFVKNEKIYSIQCAQHFISNGNDLIRRTLDECERVLNTQFVSLSHDPQFPEYLVQDKTLKLIFNSDNRALYAIYFSSPCSTPF